jgi:two-component system response regulator AtoC
MEPILIGVSRNIQHVKKIIQQVADTEINILVCGETGVGKELVVQNLYLKSKRESKPFVKVNCAAMPDTLLESEMFGYEKGAFTGAERRKRGKFEQANGGVLFLDEIGDMPIAMQSKLLHVLQDGDFAPLGSEKSVKTTAWVISATNHDLEKDLGERKFREDLYYRLGAIKIHIEPLRNRPEDISYLIDYYLEKYTSQLKGKKLKTPGSKTIERLKAYHWPGNVRQLQNALKRILVLGDGNEILDEIINVPNNSQRVSASAPAPKTPSSPIELTGLSEVELSTRSSLNLKEIRKKAADRIEKEAISFVLQKTGWNRSKAAKILDLNYKTLLYKIQELNITPYLT